MCAKRWLAGALMATALMAAPITPAAAAEQRGATAGPTSSVPAPVKVDEFPFGGDYFYPGPIVSGPDERLWLFSVRIPEGGPAGAAEPILHRIDTSGSFRSFHIPGPPQVGFPREPWPLAAGPGRSVWYAPAGYLSRNEPEPDLFRVDFAGRATGALLEPDAYHQIADLAPGPDGNLWATDTRGGQAQAVLRITPSGTVSAFPLPAGSENSPGPIVQGPDGAMWFTIGGGNRIDRITTSGEVTQVSIRRPVLDLTAGADGNLWLTTGSRIIRMTPTGTVTEFAPAELGSPESYRQSSYLKTIATGPDGRLWFPLQAGRLGRITPQGRFSEVLLPTKDSYVQGLATGPDGNLWYSADIIHPCEGSGSSCIHDRNGLVIVGKVAPGALRIDTERFRWTKGHRAAAVTLACGGGSADSVCRGRLRLVTRTRRKHCRARAHCRPRKIVIASRRYRLGVDARHTFKLRLNRRARRLPRIALRRSRVGVRASLGSR